MENSIRFGSRAFTAFQLFFADEDDPEFVSNMQAPTKNTERIKLCSKLESMRRRLNACTKCFLEFQSEGNQALANATVDHLHRPMRDSIRKSDVWSKLCEARRPSFDSTVRLASSCLACFKIGYMKEKMSTGRKTYLRTFLDRQYSTIPTWPAQHALTNPLSR